MKQEEPGRHLKRRGEGYKKNRMTTMTKKAKISRRKGARLAAHRRKAKALWRSRQRQCRPGRLLLPWGAGGGDVGRPGHLLLRWRAGGGNASRPEHPPLHWRAGGGNVGSSEDYTQPGGLVADLRIFRDRALGRQELKAIRRGVEATLPAAPAA